MSMDLNFWKYKENTAHDHETVYQTACCDGEIMEVLEILPIDDILKKVTNCYTRLKIIYSAFWLRVLLHLAIEKEPPL